MDSGDWRLALPEEQKRYQGLLALLGSTEAGEQSREELELWVSRARAFVRSEHFRLLRIVLLGLQDGSQDRMRTVDSLYELGRAQGAYFALRELEQFLVLLAKENVTSEDGSEGEE